jgi:Mn-dependent DtxR family transcriptional regulator
MTSGQITYDLRRLRLHGLIERIPRTFRYQVTDTGLRSAQFLTRVHDRFLRTGLAEINRPQPARICRPGSRRPRLPGRPRRPHPRQAGLAA